MSHTSAVHSSKCEALGKFPELSKNWSCSLQSLWKLWGNFRALQTSHKVYLKPGDSFSSFDNALIKRTCRSNLNCLYIFVNAQIFNLLLAPMLFPTYKVLFLFCKRNYNSNVNLVTYVDDKCKGKHTLKREMKQLHRFVS